MPPILILILATAFGLYGLFSGNQEQPLFLPTSTALVCGWLPLLFYPPLGHYSWLRKMMHLSATSTNEVTPRRARDLIVDAALISGSTLSFCYGIWAISGEEASVINITLVLGLAGASIGGVATVICEILDRRMAVSIIAIGRAIRDMQLDPCGHKTIDLNRVDKEPWNHDAAKD